MTRGDSQESGQRGMLPEGYTVSDDKLREMQTPPAGQDAEPKSRRTKARSTLLWIGAVLSSAAVLIGCGLVVLMLATLATDHDYTRYYSLVLLPPGLLALMLGGIGLYICSGRLTRREQAPGLPAQGAAASQRDRSERHLIAAAVLVVAAMALGWGILGQPRNAQHLRLQYLVGRRTFEGATLIGANLRGANLARVRMEHCYLEGTDLEGANLAGSDLWFTDLSGANLTGVNLRGANLLSSDLKGADLSGADLREADLSGVDLSGVSLRRADLTGAKVTAQQLRQARTLQGATMPDGSLHE